eukprot:TRINITY_DN9648_c0_g1_i1.p1 TRINITY_DN9648_c0_g1~~TRINITY_DN9648_c0_g1_i1.p1  ORF type:complete len:846 (+),score=301.92 TRINITY_DN9648_c0_g1_i1:54-2540(+)
MARHLPDASRSPKLRHQEQALERAIDRLAGIDVLQVFDVGGNGKVHTDVLRKSLAAFDSKLFTEDCIEAFLGCLGVLSPSGPEGSPAEASRADQLCLKDIFNPLWFACSHRIQRLKEQARHTQTQMRQLEQQLASANDSVAELEGFRLKEHVQALQVHDLESRLAASNSRVSELEVEAVQKDTEIQAKLADSEMLKSLSPSLEEAKQRIAELEVELAQNEQVQELENKLAASNSRVSELEVEVAQKDTEIEAKLADSEMLKSLTPSLEEAKQRIAELEVELAQNEQDSHAALLAESNDLDVSITQELADTMSKLQAAEQKSQMLEEQLADANARLAQLEEQLRIAQKNPMIDLGPRLLQEVSEREMVEADNKALKNQLAASNARISEIEAQAREQATAAQEHLETAMKAVQQELSDSAARMEAFEAERSELRQQLSAVEAQGVGKSDVYEQLSASEARTSELEDKVKALVQTMERQCEKAIERQEDLKASQSEKAELELQLTESRTQVEELEEKVQAQLSKLEASVDQAQLRAATLTQVSNEKAELEITIADLENKLKEQVSELRDRAKEELSKTISYDCEEAALQLKLYEAESKMRELELQLMEEVTTHDAKLKEAESATETLRQQLVDLEQSLAMANARSTLPVIEEESVSGTAALVKEWEDKMSHEVERVNGLNSELDDAKMLLRSRLLKVEELEVLLKDERRTRSMLKHQLRQVMAEVEALKEDKDSAIRTHATSTPQPDDEEETERRVQQLREELAAQERLHASALDECKTAHSLREKELERQLQEFTAASAAEEKAREDAYQGLQSEIAAVKQRYLAKGSSV